MVRRSEVRRGDVRKEKNQPAAVVDVVDVPGGRDSRVDIASTEPIIVIGT
jgi:hypothetical protein